jgi:iron complex transport system permease protein
VSVRHETITILETGYRKQRRRYWAVTGALAAFAILLCCTMLLVGNTNYTPRTVLRVLLGEDFGGAGYAIRTLRLPRMLGGLFAGFAFGLGGSVFQTMLRNPLANPNTIGVTAGSGVGAVLCIIVFRASATATYSVSIATGLLCTIAIYLFSLKGRFSIGRMILVGIGVQAMLNAAISYLLIISAAQDVATAMRWLSGSLNGLQLDRLYPLFLLTALCAPAILLMGKPLMVLELGEEAATTMGVSSSAVRGILIFCSVILIAVATAATGPIAFVAFLAGPVAKRLVGNGNASPLPAALFGAALVLASDLVGQFAFEQRFPVGVVTGLLGAPYLIYLLIRMNQKGEL